jgi:hypothetical protein
MAAVASSEEAVKVSDGPRRALSDFGCACAQG